MVQLHSPLTFVNIESESPDCDAHHALRMVEELDGLSVEREVPQMLVVEEVYGVFVEFERESLEEGDVVCKNLFVGEIQLENDDRIDMII